MRSATSKVAKIDVFDRAGRNPGPCLSGMSYPHSRQQPVAADELMVQRRADVPGEKHQQQLAHEAVGDAGDELG
jgi:hypothetical protein